MSNNTKRKNFPKETIDTLIIYFLSKHYSYREIQKIFMDVKNYTYPSLGYIAKVAKEK